MVIAHSHPSYLIQTLTTLDISYDQISDEGMESFTNAFRVNQVRRAAHSIRTRHDVDHCSDTD